MHMKFISFIAGAAIILAGCANQNKPSATGGDSVQLVTAPAPNRY